MTSRSKYHSKKIEVDGMTFDSRKEHRRWCELCQLERVGKITDLQRQVKYILIPTQYEPSTVNKNGTVKRGKMIERECSYIADYTYKDSAGKLHVEDVKGYRGGGAYTTFTIKRKLMLYVHGIVVEEV